VEEIIDNNYSFLLWKEVKVKDYLDLKLNFKSKGKRHNLKIEDSYHV